MSFVFRQFLRNSDFRVKLSFIDLNKVPVSISDVDLDFYTSSPTDVYHIEFRGANNDRCAVQDDGLICVINEHKFVGDELKLKCVYTILSDKYPNGKKKVTQILDTKLILVDSYSPPLPKGQIIPTTAGQNESGIALNLSGIPNFTRTRGWEIKIS